jgi:hypothetical protein
MEIELPSIGQQLEEIYKEATKESIARLKANLNAPRLAGPADIDESQFPRTHLLRKHEGWEPPAPEIVRAYFKQFQEHFDAYDTDAKLADLLDLSTNRRIRGFKNGTWTVPYEVWRTFLVITGRVPQDILTVLAFMA